MTERVSPDFVFDPKRSLKTTREERIRQFDRQTGRVKTWSYSTLKDYEECAHRTFLDKVGKIEKPSSEAMDRGTAIHLLAENYVKGELADMPAELKRFQSNFEELRAGYTEGRVELEGDWGFDANWSPTGWMAPNVWARVKLDAFVREDDTSMRVIDYKTGKKFGNEIAHSQQAILYVVSAFMRYPEVQFAKAEFWYLDQSGANTMERSYSRERAMIFLDSLVKRATTLTTATEFPPSPSKSACKYCPFSKNETCEWRVI